VDETKLMQMALDLAEKGRGYVSPNPLVGAVIKKDGRIVGEGYHQQYGEPHAEINAIKDAGDNCKDATLYVTLEPCSHEGKTPPCVDAIIEAGFEHVIIATVDPNPLTNGKSISKMMNAGIKVDVGIMEEQARRQNEAFFKYITTNMPFVTVKIAQTLDSLIADERGHSNWITCEESRTFVHKLRAGSDAILIGGHTAAIDNPQLNVRHIVGRDPYRIVLHSKNESYENLRLVNKNEDGKTIIACSPEDAAKYSGNNIKIWEIDTYNDGRLNLSKLLIRAGKEKISSILVEGGGQLFTSFLKRKLVDKIYFAIAPKILGNGVPSISNLGIDTLEHSIEITDARYKHEGDDVWIFGYPIWR
jgi:diaminohydroxyphosphoribosylaminopyrimidine deaminase / 5-amino-6-(5-phosphoribosylamino)uracil reductase